MYKKTIISILTGLSLCTGAYANDDSTNDKTVKDTGASTISTIPNPSLIAVDGDIPPAGTPASDEKIIKAISPSTLDMPPEPLKKQIDGRREKWQALGENLETGWTPGDKIYRKNDDGTYSDVGYVDNDLNPVISKFTDKDKNGFEDQLERFQTMGPDKNGKIVPYGHWTAKGFALSRERVEQLAKAGKLNKIQAAALKSGYYEKPENQQDGYILINNPNKKMSISSQELLGAFLPVGKDGKILGQTADFLMKKKQAQEKSKESSGGDSKQLPADKKLDKEAEQKALSSGWKKTN